MLCYNLLSEYFVYTLVINRMELFTSNKPYNLLPVGSGTHADSPWDSGGFRTASKIYRITKQTVPRGLMSYNPCHNLARMNSYS